LVIWTFERLRGCIRVGGRNVECSSSLAAGRVSPYMQVGFSPIASRWLESYIHRPTITFMETDMKTLLLSLAAFIFVSMPLLADEKTDFETNKKAAEQGNAEAQMAVGESYFNGKGVAKDQKQAVEWYAKAAGQGLAKAQWSLSICYLLGLGVAKDEKKWMEWLIKSADQGFAQAQTSLASCYLLGKGVAKDEKKAVELYQKAAAQGNKEAKEELKRLGK